MARNQEPDLRVFNSPQFSFSGGINTAVPQDRLADNECRDIVNLRFNDQDSLIPRNNTTTSVSQIAAADITAKITSVFSAYYFNSGAPVIKDIFTTDAGNVYTFTGGVATLIGSGMGSFFWQWKMYGDLAIGVNRTTIPKKVTSAGAFADLGGTPPGAKYIEVWNDRVWVVSVNFPNRVYASALGNAEDWTTTGIAGRIIIDIEPQDGDFITGIVAFRERLFIFKRNRIYTIQAVGGAFPTDASALAVELYSQNIGCLSAYSIQPVLDDVLYLSENGVASLVASDRVGDFNSALLSRNIASFKILKTSSIEDYEITAYVVPEHNQYWLLVPQSLGLVEITYDSDSNLRENAYILDYRRIQEGVVRWSRYIGAAAGLVMCVRRQLTQAVPEYYIAGRIDGSATTYRIWSYKPTNLAGSGRDSYSPDRAIRFRILTKSYDFDSPMTRKEFHRMFFDFIAVQSSGTSPDVTYYFDENSDLSGLWQIPLILGPNVFGFGSPRSSFKTNRKFKYNSDGARASNVTFLFNLETVDKSFGLKSLSVAFAVLPEKRVTY